jgi:hypothetical protein
VNDPNQENDEGADDADEDAEPTYEDDKMPEVSSDSDDYADSNDDKVVDDDKPAPNNAGVDPVEHTGVPVTTGEENEEDDDTVMDRKYGP